LRRAEEPHELRIRVGRDGQDEVGVLSAGGAGHADRSLDEGAADRRLRADDRTGAGRGKCGLGAVRKLPAWNRELETAGGVPWVRSRSAVVELGERDQRRPGPG